MFERKRDIQNYSILYCRKIFHNWNMAENLVQSGTPRLEPKVNHLLVLFQPPYIVLHLSHWVFIWIAKCIFKNFTRLDEKENSGVRKDCWTGSKLRKTRTDGENKKCDVWVAESSVLDRIRGCANKGETIWNKSKKWVTILRKRQRPTEKNIGQSSFMWL